ncbi:DUF4271 domain-containing protein [Bacteroidales bacterium OttesenSCG-928-C19]|nr:DUF4271 domain-containing protein [Bacteroidales bacterium OttesenSCG-928-C19]
MSEIDTIDYSSFIFYKPIENANEPKIDTSVCLYSSVADMFEQYLGAKERDTVIYRESIFENHELKKKSSGEKNRVESHFADWVFIITLGLFFLLSLIIRLNTVKAKDFIAPLFSVSSLNTVFIGGKSNMGLPVFFLYTSSCSLLIYRILEYYGIPFLEYRPIVIFLLIFFGFMGLVLFKYLLIKMFGGIFQAKGIVKMYILNALNYIFLSSIVLSVFLLPLFFSAPEIQQWVFPVLYVILGLLFFLRTIMGFKILIAETKFSKPYLFLYLCIIEILPILALAKYVI